MEQTQKHIENIMKEVNALRTERKGLKLNSIFEAVELVDRGIYQPHEKELLQKIAPVQK